MQKKRQKTIITSYIVLAIFAISFLYQTSFQITGHTIFSEQPDPSSGKDAYLRQLSSTNYGTATTLKVGTASTGGGVEFRPILWFNISSIPGTDSIVSAIVSVYVTSSATANNITLNAYEITSDWNEGEASWYANSSSTNWTFAGGDYDSSILSTNIVTNESKWYNFTITSLATDWIDGDKNNYGIMLYSPTATAGDSKEIAASDYTINTSLRPKITIEHADNAAPTINSITTTSSSSSPTIVGNDETFTLNWTDFEGENSQIYICSSNSINTSGCTDTEFCSTSLASTNPVTCSYTTSGSDNETTSFWAATCDSNNCTTSSEQYFYINNIPVISLGSPNGGETVNQSQGNYSITFNVSDADSHALFANIYYGSTQNSTTSTIDSNINLTNFCTDADSDTQTTNTCTYPWNSSGIYGTYYLTILLNDTFHNSTDSSDATFNVRSVNDNVPPQITATAIDSNLHSGELVNVNATITDDNTLTAWVLFNYTSSNSTMTENTTNLYNATFLAPAPGTHAYRIYAMDLVENTNQTEWIPFTVTAPNATVLNSTAPSTALPYSVIKINSFIYANNSLRNMYAYLNIPEGFTFLSDYPQNAPLGNLSQGETANATWFLSCPISEDTYTLNVTYNDGYTNAWNGSNMQIQVTSAIGGGYTTAIAGYPEVVKGNPYYVTTSFLQSGVGTAPDSAKITLINPIGLSTGELDLNETTTGYYYYNYSVASGATEGIWQTIVNYTKSGTSYIAQEYWKVLGTLFDVRDITVIDGETNLLNISVTLENIGTAQSDMNLQWNLTREDTGAILHSGSDEIGVDPSETVVHNVFPETTYVGQVRITFLGHYGEDHSQKAGAYKVFSTTGNGTTPSTPSTGGGGGGGGGTSEATTTSLEISEITPIIYVTKNIEKIISFTLTNNGTADINNIQATLEDIDSQTYTILPESINKLTSEEEQEVEIKFLFSETSGEQNAILKITSDETTLTKAIKIIILTMKDYYLKEIELLEDSLESLRSKLIEKEELDLLKNTINCEQHIESAKTNAQSEEFLLVQKNINDGEGCIEEIEDESIRLGDSLLPRTKTDWIWLITWTLISILIIVIILVIILIYRKFKIIDFLKRNKVDSKSDFKKETEVDKKIRALKERIKSDPSNKPKTF
ncbi:DNRLRE domain-containing protein [Methanococcoides sp. SA1]|nr:DNRLRE domain-containing protein [Methanococcoides sp. SA1]